MKTKFNKSENKKKVKYEVTIGPYRIIYAASILGLLYYIFIIYYGIFSVKWKKMGQKFSFSKTCNLTQLLYHSKPVVLNLWGIYRWWGMAALPSEEWPVGQENTASKFNISHADLFYKSQPSKDCFDNKNSEYIWGIVSHVWVKVTTMFYNLAMIDAVVGIGLARGRRAPFFAYNSN